MSIQNIYVWDTKLVTAVPADILPPSDASASAGMVVLTKLDMICWDVRKLEGIFDHQGEGLNLPRTKENYKNHY